jgi:hypothetical protein
VRRAADVGTAGGPYCKWSGLDDKVTITRRKPPFSEGFPGPAAGNVFVAVIVTRRMSAVFDP